MFEGDYSPKQLTHESRHSVCSQHAKDLFSKSSIFSYSLGKSLALFKKLSKQN